MKERERQKEGERKRERGDRQKEGDREREHQMINKIEINKHLFMS